MTEPIKYIIAFAVLIIGLFIIPSIGYVLGVILIPIIIIAAGYLLYRMVKDIWR